MRIKRIEPMSQLVAVTPLAGTAPDLLVPTNLQRNPSLYHRFISPSLQATM